MSATHRHDRLRRRRLLLLWTSPVVAVGTVTGAKLVSMTAAAEVTRTAVVLGNPEDGLRASRAMLVGNVVEPSTALLAAGTATAAAAASTADLHDAERLLREALETAPDAQACTIRYNLALVLEAQGDATSDPAAAGALFEAAHAVALDAPSRCDRVPSLTSGAQGIEPAAAADADGPGGADAGPGTDAAGTGGAGATAADDLGRVATRTSTKAGAAQDAASQQQRQDVPPTGDAQSTPVPVDARQDELEQRLTDAVQDQQERDGDGAGGAQQQEQPPAPW